MLNNLFNKDNNAFTSSEGFAIFSCYGENSL